MSLSKYINVNFWKAKFQAAFIVLVFILACFIYYIGNGNAQRPTTSSSSSPSLSSQDNNRSLLLLVTKPRSGSSYTSALIANNSNVFYTFEPLTQLFKSDRTFFNQTSYYYQQTQAILSSYFNCDFTNMPAKYLNTIFMDTTQYGKEFKRCANKMRTGYDHIDCYSRFLRECRIRSTIFLKVVRPPLRWMEGLLREFPTLKILYLIRDPRAELYSRSFGQNGISWKRLNESVAEQHCGDLSEDINFVQRFKMLYPGRVKLIRYESAVFDPLAYAKDIYNFTELQFSEATKSYIHSLQRPAEKRVDIRNDNATRSIFKWRKTPESYKTGKVIDKFCQELYDTIGYSKVPVKKEKSRKDDPLCVKYEQFEKISKQLGA